MKVVVLCTDPTHPVVPWLERWTAAWKDIHDVRLCHHAAETGSGDVLFLVSVSRIVGPEIRERFGHTLVLHASDLPEGRGWSPHIWAVLNGADEIILSLLEAADPVDTGAIWAKLPIAIPRHALHEEINHALFQAELDLMDEGLRLIAGGATPTPQRTEGATWYPRRRPSDSALDPEKSIASQFDLLRVCDPDRYPAFVDLRGHRYAVTLSKLNNEEGSDA